MRDRAYLYMPVFNVFLSKFFTPGAFVLRFTVVFLKLTISGKESVLNT